LIRIDGQHRRCTSCQALQFRCSPDPSSPPSLEFLATRASTTKLIGVSRASVLEQLDNVPIANCPRFFKSVVLVAAGGENRDGGKITKRIVMDRSQLTMLRRAAALQQNTFPRHAPSVRRQPLALKLQTRNQQRKLRARLVQRLITVAWRDASKGGHVLYNRFFKLF